MRLRPTPEEQEIISQYAAPAWIWWAMVWFVSVFVAVEAPLVLWVVDPSTVIRIQTFNGTTMVAGGLAWCCVIALVFMYPMKRMSIRLLLINVALEKRAAETLGRVDALIEKVERRVDEGILERLESHIEAIRGKVEAGAEPLKPVRKHAVPKGPDGVS